VPGPPKPLGLGLQPLSPGVPEHAELLAYLTQQRGISLATLQRNRVCAERRWCPSSRRVELQLAFPFYKHGCVVNIKYRALPKAFSQSKGGQQVFYGYDDALVSALREGAMRHNGASMHPLGAWA
jgi:hypothetical protein